MYQYTNTMYKKGELQKAIINGLNREEADAYVAGNYPYLMYETEVSLPTYLVGYGRAAKYDATDKKYYSGYEQIYSDIFTTPESYAKYKQRRCVATKIPEKAVLLLDNDKQTFYNTQYEF